jgi:hypothetical protein
LGFRSHSFAYVATTVWTEENRAKTDALLNALRDGNFAEVSGTHEFDPHEDALGVEVIKCPSGLVVWVASVQPYSLDQRFEILESSVVSPIDAKPMLDKIDADAWTDMG